MKRIEITVNGEAYPCSPTMGAMLRFRQETGKEITQIDPSSLTDLCTYLWCCMKSASLREKKPFNMSLMEFADSLSPEDMKKWNDAITTDVSSIDGGEEKKSL